MPESNEWAEQILVDVLQLPASERRRFIEIACDDDVKRITEMELLVACHGEGDFLETAASGETPALDGNGRIGNYRLLSELGEGGCGTVYLAEQEEPVRRKVALKVIKLGMDTREVIARFEAERQALAIMNHQNIARVFDCGSTDTGRPYFVMELVQGIPITRYCTDLRLTPAGRLELFSAVCGAIQHAHDNHVVHRDIKPSNILVTMCDGVATPKVIDFGIAKAMEAPLTDKTLKTAAFQMIGTPAYMSPEQGAGAEIDNRSDIYSMGVLLYELLTGTTPLRARDSAGKVSAELRRHEGDPGPPRPSKQIASRAAGDQSALAAQFGMNPSALVGRIKGDLDWIVMRCLEPDRRLRYPTAAALATDIRNHRAYLRVEAGPPGVWRRMQRMARVHSSAVRFGAIAGAMLAGGLLWSQFKRSGEGVSSHADNAAASGFTASEIDPKSIAVLPFANLSDGKEGAFFTEGVQADVVTRLEAISELKVSSGATVLRYRNSQKKVSDIGSELGAAFVLKGTVRREGQRVRVTAELSNTRTKERAWSGAYDRKLSDVIAIQVELANTIASELNTAIDAREKSVLDSIPTRDVAAYDQFLQGLKVATSDSISFDERAAQAELFFKGAVDIDPKFARAWGQLAKIDAQMVNWAADTSPARVAKADEEMARALSLDPQSPEILLDAGYVASSAHRDYPKAIAFFESVIKVEPKNSEAHRSLAAVLSQRAHYAGAILEYRQASRLDPANVDVRMELVQVLRSVRRYDEALAEQRQIVALMPGNVGAGHGYGLLAFLANGDTRPMAAFFAGLPPTQASSPEVLGYRKTWAFIDGNLDDFIRIDMIVPYERYDNLQGEVGQAWQSASVYWAKGDAAAARARLGAYPDQLRQRALAEPDNDRVLSDLATMEAFLGQRTEALDHIERATRLVTALHDDYTETVIVVNRSHVFAILKDKKSTLEAIAKILSRPGSNSIHQIARSPWFFFLHGDPEFEAMMKDPKNSEPLVPSEPIASSG